MLLLEHGAVFLLRLLLRIDLSKPAHTSHSHFNAPQTDMHGLQNLTTILNTVQTYMMATLYIRIGGADC